MLTGKEETILQLIKVASENDPNRPEFPPDCPKFPATPTFRIDVPGFKNVYLKDESKNPTGTHKDRMAWEIVVTYRDFLLAKKRGQARGSLPQFSIISSGSAAFAIGSMLNRYGLPPLKVLVDVRVEPSIVGALKNLGCEIYEADLSKKPFSGAEILGLTNNPSGIDITSSDSLDPTTRFYDWMSYEIINNSPDFVFVPFGSGHLYENILNINKKEVAENRPHDPRFIGNVSTLRNCNFIGATTNNPQSKADKLYSPHLPFVHFGEQWLNNYKYAGFCGSLSNVYIVQERFLDMAMDIAKSERIVCEYSGIAGFALMLQMKDGLPKDKKYLIVNTGKTRILSMQAH
ncbi:PLP-dependent lyase/thiolase [Candidatus Micrarchaeota archaeon]|nr:PLP-dependent lyase/thiolase [Candidatus Micrarchaeota archaeon]